MLYPRSWVRARLLSKFIRVTCTHITCGGAIAKSETRSTGNCTERLYSCMASLVHNYTTLLTYQLRSASVGGKRHRIQLQGKLGGNPNVRPFSLVKPDPITVWLQLSITPPHCIAAGNTGRAPSARCACMCYASFSEQRRSDRLVVSFPDPLSSCSVEGGSGDEANRLAKCKLEVLNLNRYY